MFGKKKKTSGIELVDSVICRFDEMIDELNEGANCCNEEIIEVQHKISLLEHENTSLKHWMKKAETFAGNLRDLVGGDS